jgi:hypothetical protein
VAAVPPYKKKKPVGRHLVGMMKDSLEAAEVYLEHKAGHGCSFLTLKFHV